MHFEVVFNKASAYQFRAVFSEFADKIENAVILLDFVVVAHHQFVHE